MAEQPKKSTTREVVETVVVAGAGSVPFVGGALSATLATALDWKFRKRTGEWLDGLAEAIEDLQARFDDVPSAEEWAASDTFADAVLQATRAAQATSDEDKLGALRNAVTNSLGPTAPTLDEQARFIRLADEFTPAHMRLLAFLHDPRESANRAGVQESYMGGSRSTLLEKVRPEFADAREWYDLLYTDLGAASLVGGGGLHSMMTGQGMFESNTTALGKRFLAFVSEGGCWPSH